MQCSAIGNVIREPWAMLGPTWTHTSAGPVLERVRKPS